MYGAIIGDYVGSIYEMDNIHTTDFPFFSPSCKFTDDTYMTIAIARALMYKRDFAHELRYTATVYCNAGYGKRFMEWVYSPGAPAYNSYGNGSAMRVSPVGWLAQSLDEALELAKATALPTHNHPEGILGAQIVAGCIYLLRMGKSKDEVRAWVEEMGYPMNHTIAELQKSYKFDVSCRGSIPQAIQAFLEATDFESAIRLAISIGGDSDTIASIAGALAEVVYPIPDEMKAHIRAKLKEQNSDSLNVNICDFYHRVSQWNDFYNPRTYIPDDSVKDPQPVPPPQKKDSTHVVLSTPEELEQMTWEERERVTELDISSLKMGGYLTMRFSGFRNIDQLDFSHFDFSRTRDMQNMLKGCDHLRKVILPNSFLKAPCTIEWPTGKTETYTVLEECEPNWSDAHTPSQAYCAGPVERTYTREKKVSVPLRNANLAQLRWYLGLTKNVKLIIKE